MLKKIAFTFITILFLSSCKEKKLIHTNSLISNTDSLVVSRKENSADTPKTCQEIVVALVKSCNAGSVKRFKNLQVRIESKTSSKLVIELFVTNDISEDPKAKRMTDQSVGWLEFIASDEKLLDLTYDPENPIVLSYDYSILGTNNRSVLTDCFENSELDNYALDKYFIKTFDVNNDGVQDKVVSSKPYEGEDLLIFLGDNSSNYKLVLKTTNFSQDGGNQISNIKQTEDGFMLLTTFPDRGHSITNYYIAVSNNSFILKKIEEEFYSWQDGYTETCVQNLNFNLNKAVDFMTEHIETSDVNCTKKYDRH